MQRGRTAGQSFRPTRFIDFFESPHKVQAKIARVIVRAVKGLTVPEIQELAGCSADTVRTTLKTMQQIKGVYIADWRHGNNITPVYAVGSLPDVEKPLSVREKVAVQKKASMPCIAQAEGIEDSPETSHYKALAEALVPKRDEQEQREVNWKYLCHISPGVVKYFGATT